MGDKVLTANRLTDGIAVWLDANGKWSTSLQEALVARHAEAVAALEAIGKKSYMPRATLLPIPNSLQSEEDDVPLRRI
jgi:hypothetical protein